MHEVCQYDCRGLSGVCATLYETNCLHVAHDLKRRARKHGSYIVATCCIFVIFIIR
jgi:hypothetical protein